MDKRSHMANSDAELIQLSRDGNSAAFEQLIFRYDKDVLSIASRFTRNSHDAKDIYQETFIRVFKGLEKFQHKSEFSTWLFRIATNVCLTYKEKKQRLNSVAIDEGHEDGTESVVAISKNHADDVLHGNEITGRIEKALHTLSPKQRLVFTLRHYQEYKLKDIAILMNCAEGTVKKYLFEATHKMRTHLHDLYE